MSHPSDRARSCRKTPGREPWAMDREMHQLPIVKPSTMPMPAKAVDNARLDARCSRWGAMVLLVGLLAPAAAEEPAAVADPLPLRRLLISPERLPSELQRARQGALIQMPR